MKSKLLSLKDISAATGLSYAYVAEWPRLGLRVAGKQPSPHLRAPRIKVVTEDDLLDFLVERSRINLPVDAPLFNKVTKARKGGRKPDGDNTASTGAGGNPDHTSD